MVGIEQQYLAAADDESRDDYLRSENRDGLTQSFFGPVMSQVPPRDRAVALWDAVWELATYPGFAEIKRSLRDRPQLATSLD